MPRYFAFLRAVNVGGASTVKMEALRRVFEALGFSSVSTFIASGNVIFDTPARDAVLLEEKIERALLEFLGKDYTPFLRTTGELSQIVAFDPFPHTNPQPGDQLGVIFLSAPPAAGARSILEGFHSPADEFRLQGREIYWLRHRMAAGAAYPIVPLDQALSEPFTTRSVGTLKKLAEKYVVPVRSESASKSRS